MLPVNRQNVDLVLEIVRRNISVLQNVVWYLQAAAVAEAPRQRQALVINITLVRRGRPAGSCSANLRFAPQVPAGLALRLRGSPTAESRPRRTRVIFITRGWRWRGASAATACGYHTAFCKTLIFRPPVILLTRPQNRATFCWITSSIDLSCKQNKNENNNN